MLEPLLIGVALCIALIIAAALVAIGHWRRSGRRPAAAGVRGAAAGPARKAMAPREIAIVPGFSDTLPPDSGAHVPVQPGRAAHPQARPAGPQPHPRGPGPQPHPRGPGPQPNPRGPGPQPNPRGPGPPANGQRAAARAVTTSEQIASYYDQADQPMADYLAGLGWNHRPPDSSGRGSGGATGGSAAGRT